MRACMCAIQCHVFQGVCMTLCIGIYTMYELLDNYKMISSARSCKYMPGCLCITSERAIKRHTLYSHVCTCREHSLLSPGPRYACGVSAGPVLSVLIAIIILRESGCKVQGQCYACAFRARACSILLLSPLHCTDSSEWCLASPSRRSSSSAAWGGCPYKGGG